MVQEQYSEDSISYEIALKMRDLEESQKISKDRLLLISQNFIESQEKNILEITELKKQVQILHDELKRVKNIVQNMSSEISKSARKEEVAILSRQYKMFEPLKLARIEDVEKIVDQKLHHHTTIKENEKENNNQKQNFWSGKL